MRTMRPSPTRWRLARAASALWGWRAVARVVVVDADCQRPSPRRCPSSGDRGAVCAACAPGSLEARVLSTPDVLVQIGERDLLQLIADGDRLLRREANDPVAVRVDAL